MIRAINSKHMLVLNSLERKIQKAFEPRLREHFGEKREALFYRISHPRGSKHATLRPVETGTALHIPKNDATHIYNGAAMLAISHAIEDFAEGIGNGELVATFQKMENFLGEKKRYVALSRKLDSVRVSGEGIPPKGCPKIDFIPTFHHELNRYWIVSYSNPTESVVLIAKQINKETIFEKKLYYGFYTFNPFLAQSIRRKLLLASCGLGSIIDLWVKQHHIPTISSRDLNAYFGKKRTNGHALALKKKIAPKKRK